MHNAAERESGYFPIVLDTKTLTGACSKRSFLGVLMDEELLRVLSLMGEDSLSSYSVGSAVLARIRSQSNPSWKCGRCLQYTLNKTVRSVRFFYGKNLHPSLLTQFRATFLRLRKA